jgi:hypothetical protein
MENEDFYTVDPKTLAEITVDDILQGNAIAPESLDYSIPVPTTDQSIPHKSRDAWFEVEWGGLDPAALPTPESGLRGRIGGC